MQVNASIDESDIGRISAGQPVSFTVDAYPGDMFAGTVSQVRLDPKVESNVVSYTTIIDVPNPSMKLKPGMTATVNVEIARADDVLKVPTSALRFTPAQQNSERATPSEPRAARPAGSQVGRTPGRGGRVWVLEEGQPRAIPVSVGITDGATTAVEGQLTEGTRIITGSATQTASSAPSGSPFIPQRRGGAGANAAAGQRQGSPAGGAL